MQQIKYKLKLKNKIKYEINIINKIRFKFRKER